MTTKPNSTGINKQAVVWPLIYVANSIVAMHTSGRSAFSETSNTTHSLAQAALFENVVFCLDRKVAKND